MASSAPLFIQNAIARCYYVGMFCTELRSDRLRNVGKIRVELHVCPYLQYDCNSTNFYETSTFLTTYCKKPLTKFHENPSNDLAADTRQQTDRQTD